MNISTYEWLIAVSFIALFLGFVWMILVTINLYTIKKQIRNMDSAIIQILKAKMKK